MIGLVLKITMIVVFTFVMTIKIKFKETDSTLAKIVILILAKLIPFVIVSYLVLDIVFNRINP